VSVKKNRHFPVRSFTRQKCEPLDPWMKLRRKLRMRSVKLQIGTTVRNNRRIKITTKKTITTRISKRTRTPNPVINHILEKNRAPEWPGFNKVLIRKKRGREGDTRIFHRNQRQDLAFRSTQNFKGLQRRNFVSITILM